MSEHYVPQTTCLKNHDKQCQTELDENPNLALTLECVMQVKRNQL